MIINVLTKEKSLDDFFLYIRKKGIHFHDDYNIMGVEDFNEDSPFTFTSEMVIRAFSSLTIDFKPIKDYILEGQEKISFSLNQYQDLIRKRDALHAVNFIYDKLEYQKYVEIMKFCKKHLEMNWVVEITIGKVGDISGVIGEIIELSDGFSWLDYESCVVEKP